jgi:hypothetical protein
VEISFVTSAREPGKPTPIRLVGTYDNEDTLLFSQGYKNFRDKTPCNWCSKKMPLMHRYAIAKKGEPIVFAEAVFCSVDCWHKRDQSPVMPPQ